MYARVDPARIGMIRFILEGYDSLATVTTVDRGGALLLLRHHASNRQLLEEILEGVAEMMGEPPGGTVFNNP